jgi:hypothetical protein
MRCVAVFAARLRSGFKRKDTPPVVDRPRFELSQEAAAEQERVFFVTDCAGDISRR